MTKEVETLFGDIPADSAGGFVKGAVAAVGTAAASFVVLRSGSTLSTPIYDNTIGRLFQSAGVEDEDAGNFLQG